MIEVRPSSIHGVGLFATQDIPANTRLADYHGEEMTLREFKERYGNDRRCTYLLRRANRIICGKGVDNVSHFCNESMNPNVCCKLRGLYTMRDVMAGEELCLRYPANYPRDYELNS